MRERDRGSSGTRRHERRRCLSPRAGPSPAAHFASGNDGRRELHRRGRRDTALIVYPWTGRPEASNPPNWDDIPGAHGSTPELEGFRDLAGEFAWLNVGLFGLSRQTTDWQREMAARASAYLPDPERCGRTLRLRALPTQLRNQRRELPEKDSRSSFRPASLRHYSSRYPIPPLLCRPCTAMR